MNFFDPADYCDLFSVSMHGQAIPLLLLSGPGWGGKGARWASSETKNRARLRSWQAHPVFRGQSGDSKASAASRGSRLRAETLARPGPTAGPSRPGPAPAGPAAAQKQKPPDRITVRRQLELVRGGCRNAVTYFFCMYFKESRVTATRMMIPENTNCKLVSIPRMVKA